MNDAVTAATDAAVEVAVIPSSTTISFYGQYCFHLSPTLNRWCPMRIAEVLKLVQYADFAGQNVFFHLNHPIKWVRIAGVVVACAEYYGRRVYTVDDGSGATIECSVPAPDRQQHHLAPVPVVNHPGIVVDLKGGLRIFRDTFQIEVVKLAVLRATQQEMRFWAKVQEFAASTLHRPWVLDRQTVRKYRKAAMELQQRNDKSK
ncbi:endo-1,3-beta glucanase [Sporothrix epigloea]|uniref:Endo-1,3-beta glucanase n=1 Tax=Sporothrix epigloea TaxID=1892477 RepID=A0ABP0DZU9_9PEZI